MRSFNILPNDPHWWKKEENGVLRSKAELSKKQRNARENTQSVYSYVITKDVNSVPIAWVVEEKRTVHEKSENTL